VWISYADRLEQPGDIFKVPSVYQDTPLPSHLSHFPNTPQTQFLHKRRIGTGLALFWCAWAFVAEKAGNFSLADRLYTKGLEVQAAPLELLAARRQQFQRRMSRHWLRLQEEAGAAMATADGGAAGE
jgi:hypothetical protein